MVGPSQETVEKAQQTARTWYQSKRVPLYIVVGGTFIGAASVLWWNSRHPHVEGSPSLRKDSLAEERDTMAREGHEHHETVGRKASREMGLHKGMESDGIFPNTKIAKKMGDVMGTTPEIAKKDPNAGLTGNK